MVSMASQAPVAAAEPRRRTLRVLGGSAALCIGAALYALAFPPFDHAWLAWFSIVPLLLVVRGLRSGRAFLYGAAYGLGCAFAVGCTWLPQAMARFFEVPFVGALLGTLIYGLLFWGTAFGIFAAGAARLLDSDRPILAAVAVAALWVATELLRGRVFEQPWGLIGYSQHGRVALIQIAAVTAVYGVSFLIALGNASIAEALASRRGKIVGRFAPLALAATLTAVAWFAGSLVTHRALGAPERFVAIVQTNVPPAVHWTRAYTDRQVLEDTHATDELVPTRGVDLIVWPENAVPRYLEVEPGLAAQLAALAMRHGSDLLFGAPRHAEGRSYNSVRLITATGHNGGYYDKQRLVFVAEANPLRRASQEGPDGDPTQFTAGGGPGVLPSFVPVGVSICHEVLFPELIARSVGAGAGLLVNVSNDGWLDPGTGVASKQQFAMAAFRAVETRRYLVRAATTGISGVVDPFGRIVDSLDVGVRGALVTPVSSLSELTPYVTMGDAFAFGCAVVAVVTLLVHAFRSRGSSVSRITRRA